jgi:hypothetical protein
MRNEKKGVRRILKKIPSSWHIPSTNGQYCD